jgi:hypothetical protein
VIPPPRGPASFPRSVNQPEAVRRSSSTLKLSPCWSRYAASREDPLRAVIPPPRGPASFPCSVNQPEAVRRSSSTLKPSPPRGPQCRVSFWNGAAAFGVGLNPRSSAHATNPSTHMPRKHGHSPLLRRAGKVEVLESIRSFPRGPTQGCDPSTKGTGVFSLLCQPA